MDVSEKKSRIKNACSKFFWQKIKSWWGKDTYQNVSARSLTLLIFAVGWGHCVVDYNPNTSQWCHCCHFLR